MVSVIVHFDAVMTFAIDCYYRYCYYRYLIFDVISPMCKNSKVVFANELRNNFLTFDILKIIEIFVLPI